MNADEAPRPAQDDSEERLDLEPTKDESGDAEAVEVTSSGGIVATVGPLGNGALEKVK